MCQVNYDKYEIWKYEISTDSRSEIQFTDIVIFRQKF